MANDKRISELEERSSLTGGMRLAAYDPNTDTTVALLASVLAPDAVDESDAWSADEIYDLGDIVSHEDGLWLSEEDDNEDNPPFEGSLFWTLKAKGQSGLVPWAAGVFTQTHVTVLRQDPVTFIWSLYYLSETDRPYNSTDFDAELAAKDWVITRDPRAIINCGSYDGGAGDDEYPDNTTNTAVGSGVAGTILQNDEFTVPSGGVDVDRGSGSEFVPGGVTFRALINEPGQVPANWKSY